MTNEPKKKLDRIDLKAIHAEAAEKEAKDKEPSATEVLVQMHEDIHRTSTNAVDAITEGLKTLRQKQIDLRAERVELREEAFALLAFTGHARQFVHDFSSFFVPPKPDDKIIDEVKLISPEFTAMDWVEMQRGAEKMRQREHEMIERLKGLDNEAPT